MEEINVTVMGIDAVVFGEFVTGDPSIGEPDGFELDRIEIGGQDVTEIVTGRFEQACMEEVHASNEPPNDVEGAN